MWNHLDLRLRSLWTFAGTKLASRRGAGKAMQRQRDEFYAFAWEQAAALADSSYEYLDEGLVEFSRKDEQTRAWKNYTTLDDPVTLRMAGNKPIVLQKIEKFAAISAWSTFTLSTIESAYAFLDGTPHVVKPARNTGAGSGVTTGIRSRRDLRKSVAIASAFDSTMLIEKQIPGANYRLLFLQGELVEIVRRDPPMVVGDGKSTVRQLVAQENSLRQEHGWRRAQTMLSIDDDMRRTLSNEGLTLRSIPALDHPVVLKTVINENRAGENVLVDDLCPEIIATCRDCALSFGIQLAGIDIITTDPSIPLQDSGGVVLEVNTTPGLYHHFDPNEMKCRVAPAILQAALRQSAATPNRMRDEKWEVAT